MKKVITLSIAALILALSGCGGDSDSSGVYTSAYPKTIPNGNVYNCPNVSAQQLCTTDTICGEQKCELTKEVVPVPDPVLLSELCKLSATNEILAKQNDSCKFVNQSDNTRVSVTCDNQQIILDGKIKGQSYTKSSFASGANVLTYRFICS